MSPTMVLIIKSSAETVRRSLSGIHRRLENVSRGTVSHWRASPSPNGRRTPEGPDEGHKICASIVPLTPAFGPSPVGRGAARKQTSRLADRLKAAKLDSFVLSHIVFRMTSL